MFMTGHLSLRIPKDNFISGPHYCSLLMGFSQAILINLKKSKIEYLSLPFQMVRAPYANCPAISTKINFVVTVIYGHCRIC